MTGSLLSDLQSVPPTHICFEDIGWLLTDFICKGFVVCFSIDNVFLSWQKMGY